ncbi:glycosylinositol phosphorylceramide mannosyl transferase 1-like isoform X2 [Gastrolobium bilobum]|uniref:glycosylinositol phosphorylceramide mannosyl transferase 1-like isoform X2 n=1 Tax=Gastrolobium bilobum TaxID=150636 RepID=UPI002AB04ABE|nr:glycosylinositol phosphorylceramide mannosyl transferase 1-like isoform X2 [Gastrolobium bilobum]
MRGSCCLKRRVEQRFRLLAISTVKSARINHLLLFCCIALTLIVLATTASTVIVSTNHAPPPRHFPLSRKGYSIVMNTWKRYDLLKQSLMHYSSCPRLESVHIVKLKFDINKEDSLNNRFKEIKDLDTDAVFSIDDDVIFPCSSVEFAFDVWQSAPDTMVGFVPRGHWVDSSEGNGDKFRYGGWWSVWWTGTYSMVLSKAAFFHKKYFSLYTKQMPASIREYVTKNRNCEDIAMSFLVANATDAPPIWVKGKIFEIGSTGISSLGGHSERRTECVNRFTAVYGRMPLVSTSVKAVDSRNIWFW